MSDNKNNLVTNYDEEREKWLEEKSDLKLDDIDYNLSIKTNFIITRTNFEKIRLWIYNFIIYLKYFRKLFDIDNILNLIFSKFENEKPTIWFNINHEVNIETNQTTAGNVYIIKRNTDSHFTVKRSGGELWDTAKLICSVKRTDGIIVYPVIKTADNQIDIHFADGMTSNYVLYFI